MLQKMHYVLDPADPLVDEAFHLLSTQLQPTVSLRNLATFLIALDSILIPSMQLMNAKDAKN